MKAVSARCSAPSSFGPFLLSHSDHFLAIFRAHLRTKAGSVSRILRVLGEFLGTSNPIPGHGSEIGPRFSDEVRPRLAFFRGADFRAMLRTMRNPRRACALGDGEICQWPAQTESCEDPTLFGLQQHFMRRTALKDTDLVNKTFTLKFLDPVCLVRVFLGSQYVMPSRASKAVTRLPNVANRPQSRVDKSVDYEAARIARFHVAMKFAWPSVKTGTSSFYDV